MSPLFRVCMHETDGGQNYRGVRFISMALVCNGYDRFSSDVRMCYSNRIN